MVFDQWPLVSQIYNIQANTSCVSSSGLDRALLVYFWSKSQESDSLDKMDSSKEFLYYQIHNPNL